MAESFYPAVAGPWALHSVIVRSACIGLLSLLLSAPARGADQRAATPVKEESVLIATREISSAETRPDSIQPADEDGLEPIPQTSDRVPDLAATNGSGATARIAGEAQTSQPIARGGIRRTPPVDSTTVPFEPVKFQGILVGKSTRNQVVANWGEPDKSFATPEGDVLAYRIHPFESVEVLIGKGDAVEAIKVALTTPLAPKHLAEQLSLDQFRTATVKNEEDLPLGQVFPERGVLFMFDAADSDALAGDSETAVNVSHVVVQPLDARAFAMRAESCLHGPYTENIRDLKIAIVLDPSFAHAHYLLARIYLATGQADMAQAAAAKACDLAPTSAAYHLCRGEAEALLGEYDSAVLTVRNVLDREDIAPIDKASALYQMARLASLGDAEIAAKAITFNTRAIEIADSLATSANGAERRAAKQLLVEAHMAMAEEIARQTFNEKTETLSLWIGRASGLAEEFIQNDGGGVGLRLLIAQRALGALASFRPTLDPSPWVAEAEDAARAMFEQSDDELWQARVKWELGVAYLNALRVDHVRRETATALQYGQKAVDNLAEGAASRQAVHASEQLVGQLYFQMGAVYAVHQLDHKTAAQWYDKADSLLTGPRPASELYAPRREGEMLVSMGVSYWQLGEQARALQLTQSGVNLVEIAVQDGILAKTALAVPYGNLASMYKKIGETTNAAKYSELAKSVAPPVAAAATRIGIAPVDHQDSIPRTSARMPRSAGNMR